MRHLSCIDRPDVALAAVLVVAGLALNLPLVAAIA
jgi:hypothetical protein